MQPDRPSRSGSGTRTRAPLAAKKSQLPLVIGGAVLLAGIIVAVILLKGGTEEKRRVAEEAEYANAPAIEAVALAKAWRANPAETDKQYKTAVLAVTGVVSRTDSLEGAYGAGKQHVVFLLGLEGLEIDGRIDPAHAAGVTGVKAGDKVTLVGRYAGESGGGQVLVLRNCRKR